MSCDTSDRCSRVPQKSCQEVDKTAQWLRALGTLPEGLGLIPRTHVAAPAAGDPAPSSDLIKQESVL